MTTNRAGYQSEYRSDHPAYVRRQRQLDSARKEARRILAERYPDEYEKLYAEVKEKRGL